MKKKTIIKIASFIAVTTAAIHLINKYVESSALLKRLLNKTEDRYYDWKLGRIHYTVCGEGAPVLLIHDLMPGSSVNEWNSIKNELAKNHTVYCIDMIGCGLSDKLNISYTNFLYVQMLDDFISNVIGEEVDIVSTGLSCSIVLMKHLHNSENIGKIIMINPPALQSVSNAPSFKDNVIKSVLKVPVFGTLLYNMIFSRENVYSIFMDHLFYNPFKVSDEVVDTYYESVHKNTAAAKDLYISILSKYLNAPISNALSEISEDLYIIEGSDEINESITIDKYLEINENIHVSYVENTKHLPHIERPGQFMNTLSKLL